MAASTAQVNPIVSRPWLQEQFQQHHGNAEEVRQELLKQKAIEVSLRRIARAVEAYGRCCL